MTSVVWITRTRDGAARTAAEVAARGFEPLIAPVLEVTALEAVIDADSFDALIVTSGNAVNALATLSSRDTPVFCTGDATAQAARDKGFGDARSAHGDVRALFDLIRAEVPKSTRLLYAAPRQPAAPLARWLGEEGYDVQQVAVYETRTIDPGLSDDDCRRVTHVLIHSPRAGEAVARATIEHSGRIRFQPLTFVCISEAAWRAAENALAAAEAKNPSGLHVVPRISQFPVETSMLDLLG